MIKGIDYTGITCGCICHDGNGKVLMGKRSKNCRDEQGAWEFGGGSMEFGETLEEHVSREVKEEFGVEIKELKEYNTNLLPQKKPTGKGDINEILNTEAFIQAVKLPDFYTLLYPTEFRESHNLIPDALMVLKSKEERKYKLIFLEVEAKKPNWIEKLAGKRENYVLLSKDYRFYDYWKTTSERIGLPMPDISQLKFSVYFICSIKENFGNGFHFTQSLTN
jgi:8-oxo-dGTP pyrophosphatase MutT (NUDIX family)